MLANKVTINLNVFGSFMKNVIVADLDGTAVVTIKSSGRGLRSTEFIKESSKPYKFL
ncbi:hypothetical protein LguiB_006792 [Lonicera macranthoides]